MSRARSAFIGSLIKQLHTSCDQAIQNVISDLLVLVSEIKGLKDSGLSKSKAAFYCEVELDGDVYARTSCKVCNNSDSSFWGERFQFPNLRAVHGAVVKVYRDPLSKRKSARQVLGTVTIPLSEAGHGEFTESWHTLEGTSRSHNSLQLRLRTSYQRLVILSSSHYLSLQNYILHDVDKICHVLEPLLPSKSKDELAQTLVYILKTNSCVVKFMSNVLVSEVETLERENLILRANSFASKSIDCYMKLTGTQYLKDTLRPVVHYIINSSQDCEVDPGRLTSSDSINTNRATLLAIIERVWSSIYGGLDTFPRDLRYIFSDVRCRVADRGETTWKRIVSGTVFLRFFCPAILSPSLFHLTNQYPNEKACRRLTLVAKVIQNLANATRFGGKEGYMTFVNDFMDREMPTMDIYLNQVSSATEYSPSLESCGVDTLVQLMAFDLQAPEPTSRPPSGDFDDDVPLTGRESRSRLGDAFVSDARPICMLDTHFPDDRNMAVLHRILAHHLPRLDPLATRVLDTLNSIVAQLQADVTEEKSRLAQLGALTDTPPPAPAQQLLQKTNSSRFSLFSIRAELEEEPSTNPTEGRLEKRLSELGDDAAA